MNELKLTIEFVRMVNEKMSYLIINHEDENEGFGTCKFVATGTDAGVIASEIAGLIESLERKYMEKA
jgi:hypothetical protein